MQTEISDRVTDAGAEHVADHAGDDDPDQSQVMGIDVEAGEQHRHLGTGHDDDLRHHDHQRHPGVAQVLDHVCGDIGERVGNGGVDKHALSVRLPTRTVCTSKVVSDARTFV